jgi:TetR/AcrR family transcriptional regulator, fatty acid metabolism regulator protein
MRTNERGPGGEVATFTQLKRRDQLVDCAIDAIAELGFPRASVAEVARRAGVSKGVVTYHFAAKDDLISAVIAGVLESMREYIGPYMLAANPQWLPEKLIRPYITAYASFYRTHAREVLALVRIYNAFRDESGRPNAAFDARADEVTQVGQALQRGQARGAFGIFDPDVMAATMKAALDDLLTQFADDPQLDLEAYSAELVALFERATRPDSDSPSNAEPGSEPTPDIQQLDQVKSKEER